MLAILLTLGAGWGLTQSLSKISVSTGFGPFGLLFWQALIGAVLLGGIAVMRGARVPLTREALGLCILIAFLGTVIPNSIAYAAYRHLPQGVMSIIISTVPMIAFPVALAIRAERFNTVRFGGLVLGLIGIVMIASAPIGGTGGLDAATTGATRLWVMIALLGPLCYALEGNIIGKWGTAGLDPIVLMCGASAVGAAIALPLAIGTGQWIDPVRGYGAPEYALVVSSVIHALMYAGYVWLVGRAGAVFASQTAYLVTGSGVLWAMLLLGERFPPLVWLALAVMFAGIFLVQPRTVSETARA